MSNIMEILTQAGIPLPVGEIDSGEIIRWGKNNRYWLKRVDTGYIYGDFVDGLSSFCPDIKSKYNESQRLKKISNFSKKDAQKSSIFFTVSRQKFTENAQKLTENAQKRPKISNKKFAGNNKIYDIVNTCPASATICDNNSQENSKNKEQTKPSKSETFAKSPKKQIADKTAKNTPKNSENPANLLKKDIFLHEKNSISLEKNRFLMKKKVSMLAKQKIVLEKNSSLLRKKSDNCQEMEKNSMENINKNENTIKSHPYLLKKQIELYGVTTEHGEIVIPLYDIDNNIRSFQYITENGRKRFKKGGKKKGHFFVIGESLNHTKKIYIAEGYATGATIYKCLKETVVVAFDSGNLKPVAEIIRAKYPNITIVICADNDQWHTSGINAGLVNAQSAAQAVNGIVVVPCFEDVSSHPTDFNDLYVLEGELSVIDCIAQEELEYKTRPILPDNFEIQPDGLYYTDPKKETVSKISLYIKPLAFVRTDSTISKLFEFKDYNGQIKQLVVQPGMTSRDGDAVRVALLGKGFMYAGTSFAKNKLFEFIMASKPIREAVLITKPGYYRKFYVQSDHAIGTPPEGVIISDNLHSEAIETSGTLSDWNDQIAKYCEGNSRLIFAIATAFASVLIKQCNIANCGFHFVGNSSTGKTTTLRCAASVFGNHKYIVTWKTTDNALENIAYNHNDALLILDEISEISPVQAGEVAYMLANGQGKKRLDKNCTARLTLSWNLLFLSSGEVDLNSHMSEAQKKGKAGQKVRLLNIPANTNKYGIFEKLHGFSDGAELSNYLCNSTNKYYGTAIIAFIEKVLLQHDILSDFQVEYKKLKAKYLPQKASGQDLRAFEKFMFVGYAGELAIKYKVVDWEVGASYSAGITCFKAWLDDKDGVGDDESRQIIQHTRLFFDLHGHSRFFDLNGYNDQKIINMAGYRQNSKDELTFFVFPSVFQKEMCEGFSRQTVIDTLLNRGILLADHHGDYRQVKSTPDGIKRVYVFSGTIIGDNHE